MIQHQFILDRAVYGFLDMHDAGAVERASAMLTSADHEVVADIRHNTRRHASLLARGLTYYLFGQLSNNADYLLVKSGTGRPSLEDKRGNRQAFISLAHSRDVVACVIDMDYPAGIDVEYCRYDRDYKRITERIFPQDIAGRIQSQEQFYQAWCLYEAWGKANDLKHIDSQQNTGLMSLVAAWLNLYEDEGAVSAVKFFRPDEQYAGCIYRAIQRGEICKRTSQ